VTGAVATNTQIDDMGRPAVVSSTDNGVSTTEVNLFDTNNMPFQTIFPSSAAQVQYNYYPAGSNTGSASPLALSTLSIQNLTGSTLASATYGYSSSRDTTSKRLGTITLPGMNPVTITYDYFHDTDPNTQPDGSNQVQNVLVTSPGNPSVTLTYLRDTAAGGNRGRITYVGATSNGGSFQDSATGSPVFNQQDQIAGQQIRQPAVGTQQGQTDTWSYSYNTNQADALTSATDTLGLGTPTTYNYNYDGIGNRAGTSLGTPNLVNEYSNLSYNQRGNLTSDGTYKYGYDALDRLISITPISPTGTSTQEQYGYDDQGRRLWKDVYTWNAASNSWTFAYTRTYVWDGGNLAAELGGNGNLLIRYIYGPTGLIAEQDYPSDTNYSALLAATNDPSGQPVTIVAVSDLSGNVDEMIDARAGTIVGEFRYDPWGKVISSAGPATALDGLGGKGYFVDNEAPNIGESPQPGGGMPHAFNFALEIWLQRDRADQSQVISVTGVPFGNDPINKVDPDGLAALNPQQYAQSVADRVAAVSRWVPGMTPAQAVALQLGIMQLDVQRRRDAIREEAQQEQDWLNSTWNQIFSFQSTIDAHEHHLNDLQDEYEQRHRAQDQINLLWAQVFRSDAVTLIVPNQSVPRFDVTEPVPSVMGTPLQAAEAARVLLLGGHGGGPYSNGDEVAFLPTDRVLNAIEAMAAAVIVRDAAEESAGRIVFGALDHLDRPSGVYAEITEDMIGNGSRATVDPPGFFGEAAGHARGHLLGKQLGGSGSEPLNIVTLYHIPTNTPVMRGFENQVRAAVEAGETVRYWSIPVYEGSSLIPKEIRLVAQGNRGFGLSATITNAPRP
jgi:hypothetical protein